MARPRRNVEKDRTRQSTDRKSGSDTKKSAAGAATTKKSSTSDDNQSYYILGVIVLSLSIVAYYYVQNWLDTRVATPLSAPKAVTKSGLEVPSMYWGSYRPGVYFGLKTRSPQSPVFGLMWFTQKITNNQLPIRHWCEMGDHSQRYTWLEHDGQNFGIQEIHDDNVVLTTSFVKHNHHNGSHGGDWTAKISATVEDPNKSVAPLSLLFYVALDVDGQLEPHVRGTHLASIGGNTHDTGPFRLAFPAATGGSAERLLATNYLSTEAVGLEVLKETVMNSLAYFTTSPASTARRGDAPKYVGLVGEKYPEGMSTSQRHPNFIVHQVTVTLPFEMEVTYESFSQSGVEAPIAPLTGAIYEAELTRLSRRFGERFDRTFDLGNYSAAEVSFAKAAFSNLVGGIGYFHGRSSVQGRRNREPLPYFEAPLFTAVPSRSFFPRGFLWDEGFHQLLVSRWSPSLSRDVLAHWFDLINWDGWIPREQILDREALARVPAEFVVQRDVNANPPTLFMPLRALLDEAADLQETLQFLRAVFPRLEAWFAWFNTTQLGALPGTYRWRGRSNVSAEELNPITLTSGLDDYPRASHPTDDERHVDLRCWMAYAAGVMSDAARLLGYDWQRYHDTYLFLSDNRLLDQLHWSDELGGYADYGLHTDKVKLVRPKSPPPSAPGQPSPPTQRNPVRVYGEAPKLQFVNAHGYVTLFPLLLRLLQPDSDKLGRILADLDREDLMWTEFGLRSLARNAALYAKPNTPSSPPYWRGAIWININYLALSALRHYADVKGPHQHRAALLHGRLRKALVRNLFRQYSQTGYMWEQYNDKDGSGQRAHPFTGWSALITLIMAGK